MPVRKETAHISTVSGVKHVIVFDFWMPDLNRTFRNFAAGTNFKKDCLTLFNS